MGRMVAGLAVGRVGGVGMGDMVFVWSWTSWVGTH